MSGKLRWMGRNVASEVTGSAVSMASYAKYFPGEADELVAFAASELDDEAVAFLRRILDAKKAGE